MKNTDTLVEVLLNRAEAEQEICNRLYKGDASKESYLVAQVTAQVLRNVADAVRQAENIESNTIKVDIKEDIAGSWENRIEARKRLREIMNKPGEWKKIDLSPDPDIFRSALEELLNKITEKRYDERLAGIVQATRAILDHNPISPARAIQSKYEGLLRECLEVISDLKSHMPRGDKELYNRVESLRSELTDILLPK